ncbi:YjfB family protein [Neisseriaceae bacterium TC5R-5]|nr:YjfB family protein [Neisseriaceae bacterium TC5R-5]
MEGLSQITGQNVSTGVQIFALKKAMSANAQSALSLIEGASESSAQIRASNPPNLGNSIDTRA